MFEDLVAEARWPSQPSSPKLKGGRTRLCPSWESSAFAAGATQHLGTSTSQRSSVANRGFGSQRGSFAHDGGLKSASLGPARHKLDEPFSEPLSSRLESEECDGSPFSSGEKAPGSASAEPRPRVAEAHVGAWAVVWVAFDQLEGQHTSPIAMKQLFSALTSLEVQHHRLENGVQRGRNVRVASAGTAAGRLRGARLASEVLSAWHLEVARNAHGELKTRLEAHQEAGRRQHGRRGTAVEGLGVFLQRQRGLSVKRLLASWRLHARAHRRLLALTSRSAGHAEAAARLGAHRLAAAVSVAWRAVAAASQHHRQGRRWEGERRSLDEQLRAQETASGFLGQQLEDLARRHEALGEHCREAFLHAQDWGDGGGTDPAVASRGPQRPLATLYRERHGIARELHQLADHSARMAERLQPLQEEAAAQRWPVSRHAGAADPSNAGGPPRPLASSQAVSEALNECDAVQKELERLHSRDAVLRQALAQADHAIQSQASTPEVLLHKCLQDMQMRADLAHGGHATQAEHLRNGLERSECETLRLQAEHQAEQRRSQDDAKVVRAELEAELAAERRRVKDLTEEVGDMHTFVEHLKEANAARERERERHDNHEHHLTGIKQALSELTDISQTCFGGTPQAPASASDGGPGLPPPSPPLSPLFGGGCLGYGGGAKDVVDDMNDEFTLHHGYPPPTAPPVGFSQAQTQPAHWQHVGMARGPTLSQRAGSAFPSGGGFAAHWQSLGHNMFMGQAPLSRPSTVVAVPAWPRSRSPSIPPSHPARAARAASPPGGASLPMVMHRSVSPCLAATSLLAASGRSPSPHPGLASPMLALRGASSSPLQMQRSCRSPVRTSTAPLTPAASPLRNGPMLPRSRAFFSTPSLPSVHPAVAGSRAASGGGASSSPRRERGMIAFALHEHHASSPMLALRSGATPIAASPNGAIA